MSYFGTVINLLKQEKLVWRVVFMVFVIMGWDLILTIVQQQLQSKENGETARLLVGLWFCLDPVVNQRILDVLRDGGRRISMVWKNEHWTRYSKASYDTRIGIEPDNINRQMERASWSVFGVVEWGVPSIVGVVSSVISTFYIFWSNALLHYAFFSIFVNIVSYNLFTKGVFKYFFKRRSEIRDEGDRLRCVKQMSLPRLQVQDEDETKIVGIEVQLEAYKSENIGLWQTVNLRTSLTNGLLITTIFYFNMDLELTTFFLIMGSLRSFSTSLNGSMQFLNQYSEMEESFVTFEKLMEKTKEDWKKGVSNVEKKDLPDKITVPAQQFEHDGFTLSCPEMDIGIANGEKILIKGPSGAGKSTFISGLMGKFLGFELMDGNHYLDARCYYHNFVEFFQNIKEKIPTSKVTVRQLFDDEPDDEVIKQCCEIAGATWVNKLTKVEKKKKVYPDWTIHGVIWKAVVDYSKTSRTYSFIQRKFGTKIKKDDDLVDEQVDVEAGPVESNGQADESKDKLEDKSFGKLKDNPLDQEINERHSGGEKTRLILATRVYRMRKLLNQNRNRVFILDEPEQGSDPPLAYTILDRIKDEFPNLTIIVVSHLERIDEKEWWDKKLFVEDGIIRAVS